MDRKWLEREELDGKLIAYLDGELSAAECEELEARLAYDSDLRSALDDYRYMSECLEELCAAGASVTPAHILARFRVGGPIPGKPDLVYDKGAGLSLLRAVASSDFDNAAEPRIPKDLPISANQNDDVLIDLAASRTTKWADAIKKVQVYSFKNFSQMAAALVLGVFIGPQLFNGAGMLHNAENVGPIQLRSADKVSATDRISAKKPITVLALSEQGVFEKEVKPEDHIENSAPFIVEINAPVDGTVIVYVGGDLKESELRSKEATDVIHESSVKVGDRVVLPASGAFTVSGQDHFTLIVVFEGKGEKHETVLEYYVE